MINVIAENVLKKTSETSPSSFTGWDPRINYLVYGEKDSEESQHDRGILKGYAKENLYVIDVKKRDGEYTSIIIGRTSEEEDWKVLAEGDYYKLRKILLDQ